MSFIEKIQNKITGTTPEQRANDRLANSIASRQIHKAAFEERSRQMTRVAVEKEKLRAENMLRRERQKYAPKKPGQSGFLNSGLSGGNYSSPIGGPSILQGAFSGYGKRTKVKRYRVI